MTQEALIAIIMCICNHAPNQEIKLRCAETYVNCAIVDDGKILTKEEFDKKCHFLKGQEACYK